MSDPDHRCFTRVGSGFLWRSDPDPVFHDGPIRIRFFLWRSDPDPVFFITVRSGSGFLWRSDPDTVFPNGSIRIRFFNDGPIRIRFSMTIESGFFSTVGSKSGLTKSGFATLLLELSFQILYSVFFSGSVFNDKITSKSLTSTLVNSRELFKHFYFRFSII